jgi:hypothetical protein
MTEALGQGAAYRAATSVDEVSPSAICIIIGIYFRRSLWLFGQPCASQAVEVTAPAPIVQEHQSGAELSECELRFDIEKFPHHGGGFVCLSLSPESRGEHSQTHRETWIMIQRPLRPQCGLVKPAFVEMSRRQASVSGS